MRATSILALAVMLAANAALATPPVDAAKPSRRARLALSPKRALTTTSAPSVDAASPWAARLGPIEVQNRNTNAHGSIRLYDVHGELDRSAARTFMRLAGSGDGALADASEEDERLELLDLRLVQLVVRAAYAFGGAAITIVSAMRPGAHGKHGTGEALDFSLGGVAAPALAAYLRTTARAGVGLYTHPKTQYVHLDVREHSYHWLDGSPPGITWREQLLPDPKQAARDGRWTSALDLPVP